MEDVFRQWNARVKVSSGEAITVTFLQGAVIVWDWLLKKESTRSLIVQVSAQALLAFAFASRVCWPLFG